MTSPAPSCAGGGGGGKSGRQISLSSEGCFSRLLMLSGVLGGAWESSTGLEVLEEQVLWAQVAWPVESGEVLGSGALLSL